MDDCVYIRRDMFERYLYGDKNFNVASMLLHLLFCRDDDTNTYKTSIIGLKCELGIDEKKVKETLSKLNRHGLIQIYKDQNYRWTKRLIIALRKADIYDIGNTETYYDDLDEYRSDYRRTETGYTKFRNKVLERDNYTCQKCGSTENLEVHHKKPYAKYPKLRTVVSNGITLCKECHKKEHSK